VSPRVRPVTQEHGSVSIVVVALVGIVAVLAMFSVDLVLVLGTKERAQTAADAAALAAAQELLIPTGRTPSEMAETYAKENGADFVSCTCEPGSTDAVVVVERTVSLLFLAQRREVRASSRAVVDDP
jgi:secretion/DNA translocation related TadE-like protein